MSFLKELLTTGLMQLCLALAIALALLTTPLASEPQVRLAQGTVRGFADGQLEYFRGIRYALTTAGSGRYRRPRPIWEHLDHVFEKESIQVNRTDASGVYDASFYSPSCPREWCQRLREHAYASCSPLADCSMQSSCRQRSWAATRRHCPRAACSRPCPRTA